MSKQVSKIWVSCLIVIAMGLGALAVLALPGFAARDVLPVQGAETELFPNGDFEGEGPAWANFGGTPTSVSEGAHGGSKALRVSGLWARMSLQQSPIFGVIKAGLTEGSIYTFSAWTKAFREEGVETIDAGAHLVVTGQAPSYPNTRVALLDPTEKKNGFFPMTGDDWTQQTGYFGLIKQADGTIGIYANGVLSSSILTDVLNLDVDFGTGPGGYLYFDDVSLTKGSMTKDVTISLKDDGAAATGKEIVVKDADGTALSTQPTIEENNGKYTIKDLAFASLSQTYRYSVTGTDGMPDGVINATQDTFERDLTAYTAILTVNDESGAAVSDATVTATVDGKTANVENKGNGVYEVAGLYAGVELLVEKSGLIPRSLSLNPANPTATVVLKAEIPATSVNGNMIANGNFEGDLASGSEVPGFWFGGDAFTFRRTTNEQQDGKYGIFLAGNNISYRLDLGQFATDGSKNYAFAGAFKSDLGGSVKVDLRLVATQSIGGWISPTETIFTKELTENFETVSAVIGAKYDEVTKRLIFSVDGTEKEYTEKEVTGIAAVELVFTAVDGTDKPVYMDNLSCLETYEIDFTIREAGKDVTEGVSFEIVGFDGKPWLVTPAYSNGKWRIPNASGVVRVTAKLGSKTFPEAVFDSRNTSLLIETEFTVTVTLKDDKGNAVKGATVVARRGSADLFTLTDNGDGTYSYTEAMGTFNIYVTLEGYIFPTERNVDSSKSSLTITATSSPNSGDDGSGDGDGDGEGEGEKKKSGCGSIAFGAGSLAVALMLLGAVTVAIIFICKRPKKD